MHIVSNQLTRWLVCCMSTLLPLVIVAGCSGDSSASKATQTPPSQQGPETATGLDLWRGLVVAPEDRCSPYDPDDYLYSQAVEQHIVASMGGIIYGPYTGKWFDSTSDTDIEHIVARSEAHDSGLCASDAATRRQFASDLINLTLASPEVNRSQKSGKDAAEWLPDLNRCWFARRVIEVRYQYDLTIDERERDVLESILSACTSTELIVLKTPPASTATSAPTPKPDPRCSASDLTSPHRAELYQLMIYANPSWNGSPQYVKDFLISRFYTLEAHYLILRVVESDIMEGITFRDYLSRFNLPTKEVWRLLFANVLDLAKSVQTPGTCGLEESAYELLKYHGANILSQAVTANISPTLASSAREGIASQLAQCRLENINLQCNQAELVFQEAPKWESILAKP